MLLAPNVFADDGYVGSLSDHDPHDPTQGPRLNVWAQIASLPAKMSKPPAKTAHFGAIPRQKGAKMGCFGGVFLAAGRKNGGIA